MTIIRANKRPASARVFTAEEIAAYQAANPIPHRKVFAVQLRAAEIEKTLPAGSERYHEQALARAARRDYMTRKWQALADDARTEMQGFTASEVRGLAEGFGVSDNEAMAIALDLSRGAA